MKFNEYIDNYLVEYVLFPEYKQVMDFISFLKNKNIKSLDETNFIELINEYGKELDLDFINKFWSEFAHDLRSNGISDNFNYN